MNYLEFRNKHIVPPGGWQYEDDKTGTRYGYRNCAPGRMRFNTLDALCTAIIEDRSVRREEVPIDIANVVEDFNCRKLSDRDQSHSCKISKELNLPAPVRNTLPRKRPNRFSLKELHRGMQVFKTWLAAGMPMVARDEANMRGSICVGCSQNIFVSGCKSCTAIGRTILSFKPKAKTPYDAQLHNCGICKCMNQAQIWCPVEYLKMGTTPDMIEKFPDHCWKKKLLTEDDDNGAD